MVIVGIILLMGYGDIGLLLLIGGGIFLLLGIILAVAAKPTYGVEVYGPAGLTAPRKDKDRKFISSVVSAINEAIVWRGRKW